MAGSIDAVTWFGITANCAVIALIAHGTLRAGATDLGVLPLRHRRVREAIRRDHPHLWRRTTVLILVTFVPLLVGLLALAEALRDALRGMHLPAGVTLDAAARTAADPSRRP